MNRPSLSCAIYTRKSSEEGLEQDFNSLHAQREACEAFVRSQQDEGWKLLPTAYDDGGFSGGNIDRPALQRLLADIELKRIRIVVVYKVDRLTRSLADFAKIVERFDALGVSFVSLTQQFNTTSSMGRLTLNVLLSFAQFEREVTGERIRDKIAASKQKGLWMGGFAPIGYHGNGRILEVDPAGAEQVRYIFARYIELRCVRTLKQALDDQRMVTPQRIQQSGRVVGGRPYSRGQIYRMLSHPVYRGMIVHAEQVYPGQHLPIIDEAQWNHVQEILSENRQGYQKQRSIPSQSLLAGKLIDSQGRKMIPSHSQKQSQRYRYYLSAPLTANLRDQVSDGVRVPAEELEKLVVQQLVTWLSNDQAVLDELGIQPEMVQPIMAKTRQLTDALTGGAEQCFQCLQNLLDGVVVDPESVDIRIRQDFLCDVPGNSRSTASANGAHIVINVPVSFKRCGYRLRMLFGGSQTHSTRDQRLIESIRKAIAWRNRLTSGQASCLGDIAKQEKVSSTYVTWMIYRSFLAPDIVRAILDGTQPPSFTSNTLKQYLPLPIDWNEQQALLGFEQR